LYINKVNRIIILSGADTSIYITSVVTVTYLIVFNFKTVYTVQVYTKITRATELPVQEKIPYSDQGLAYVEN
jgi:hypothetical protein